MRRPANAALVRPKGLALSLLTIGILALQVSDCECELVMKGSSSHITFSSPVRTACLALPAWQQSFAELLRASP